MSRILFILIVLILLTGCNKKYTPKPRGYMRIDFPEKEYQLLDTIYPYKFEYPVYGKIVSKKSRGGDPFWIDLKFPEFKGTLHISYKVINNNLFDLSEESRSFAYKHSVKAKSIEETQIIQNQKNIYGILYSIKGNTASSLQFYMTDSTENFLRGALYFYTQPNIDSLSPVINFFAEDINHLINTFEWK